MTKQGVPDSIAKQILSNKSIKSKLFKETKSQRGYISTGSLSLNVLFSGRMDGGIIKGKVSMIAAESAGGKSFIAMKLIKNAQKQGMTIVLVDTEWAFDPVFARNVGVNTDELIVIQNSYIEEVQQNVISVMDEIPEEEKDNVLFVIDSWGNLVSSKSYNDAIDGKDVTDMTLHKKKNSFSRLITSFNITTFIVNQVYSNFNMYDPLSISGGSGVYYASSSVVMGTSKAKSKGKNAETSKDEINGAIITARTDKGRFCKEHTKLKFLIKHNGGIHPAYGMMDDALLSGHVVKPQNGWYTRPGVENDKKWREKELYDEWQEFWQPLVADKSFRDYISGKYEFKDSDIIDEDFEF